MPVEARSRPALKWIALAVVLVGVFALLRALPVGRGVELLRGWVETLGPWGLAAFGLGYALAALLFVPGSTLTVAAGAEGESAKRWREWTLLAVGLLATVAVTIYVTRLARRALRKRASPEEEPADAAGAKAARRRS